MSVNVTALPNGVRVVTEHMPNLETVSLGIWFGTGSRNESINEHGVSHVLEHMAFKGTPTRTARAIVEEIEAVGGELNAATSIEHTCYYVRILKQDVNLALTILSDILQNPLFDEDELAREKDVILQEIAANEDSPEDLAFDSLQRSAFRDQALGRSILGTPHSVRRISSTDLKSYMARHYTGDRMVVAAAGAIDHDKFVAHAQALFSRLPPSGEQAPSAARYTGGTNTIDKPIEQAHLVLGFKALSYLDRDYYAAQVMSGILGGSMSSRLFQEVRENRGLCYTIYSFNWGFADLGLFGIHAATAGDQTGQALTVIAEQLSTMAADSPSNAELDRAKAQLKAGLLMSMENSAARAEQLARQLLVFGEPLKAADLIAKVDAISAEDIRNVANRIFMTEPTFASVGPVGGALQLIEPQSFLRTGV